MLKNIYSDFEFHPIFDNRLVKVFISRHLTLTNNNNLTTKYNQSNIDLQISLRKPKLLNSNVCTINSDTPIQIEMKLHCLDSHFLFVHMELPSSGTDNKQSLLILLSIFLDGVIDRRLMTHGLSKEIIQAYEEIDWKPFFETYFDIYDGKIELITDNRFFVL